MVVATVPPQRTKKRSNLKKVENYSRKAENVYSYNVNYLAWIFKKIEEAFSLCQPGENNHK